MSRRGEKGVWVALIELVGDLVSAWSLRGVNGADRTPAMAWWHLVWRWSARIAFRFGRLALRAEHRYYAAAA